MAIDPFKGSPFKDLAFAGELDDLMEVAREITMNEKWQGYLNQRVINELNTRYPGRLSHLRFIPDKEQGMVIILPASEGDYGAVELDYTSTESGAFINLRLALKRFTLQKQENRVRVFTITERQGDDGQGYPAFVVKNHETRPTRKLKKGQTGKTQTSSAASKGDQEAAPTVTTPASPSPSTD